MSAIPLGVEDDPRKKTAWELTLDRVRSHAGPERESETPPPDIDYYERMFGNDTREKQQARSEDVLLGKMLASGIAQSGANPVEQGLGLAVAKLAQLPVAAFDEEAGQRIRRVTESVGQHLSEQDTKYHVGPITVNPSGIVRGTAQSIGMVAPALAAGPVGGTGLAALWLGTAEAQDTYLEAKDKGYSGTESLKAAVGAGAIEAGTTLLMGKLAGAFGSATVESAGIEAIVAKGYKDALRQVGKVVLFEDVEEVMTELGHLVNRDLNGLQELTPESAYQTIFDTVVQSTLMAGATGGSRVRIRKDVTADMIASSEKAPGLRRVGSFDMVEGTSRKAFAERFGYNPDNLPREFATAKARAEHVAKVDAEIAQAEAVPQEVVESEAVPEQAGVPPERVVGPPEERIVPEASSEQADQEAAMREYVKKHGTLEERIEQAEKDSDVPGLERLSKEIVGRISKLESQQQHVTSEDLSSAEDEFSGSGGDIPFLIREHPSYPRGLRDTGANMTQEQLDASVNAASEVLQGIGRRDLEDRIMEFVEDARQLGTSKDVSKERRRRIRQLAVMRRGENAQPEIDRLNRHYEDVTSLSEKLKGKEQTKIVNEWDDEEDPFLSLASGQESRVVTPSPLEGGEVKKLSDIKLDFTKGVSRKLIDPQRGMGSSSGRFYEKSGVAFVSTANDLRTTVHEIAHALESDSKTMRSGAYDAELKPFQNMAPPDADAATLREEGLAELVHNWVLNPDEVERMAPKATSAFMSGIGARNRKALRAFSDDVRRWYGLSARDKFASNIQSAGKIEPSLLEKTKKALSGFVEAFTDQDEFSSTWIDRARTELTNKNAPFERAIQFLLGGDGKKIELLPDENPAKMLERAALLDVQLDQQLKTGTLDYERNKTGRGSVSWLLEPLAEDAPDMETLVRRMDDTVFFGAAERVLEKSASTKGVILGVGAGFEKDSEIARQAIAEFEAKPPAEKAMLREAMARYRQFADDTLQFAVDAGLYSEKEAQKIRSENEHYVAFNRVMEDAGFSKYQIAEADLSSGSRPIKKFKGSGREVKNPYISLLNAMRNIRRAAANNDIKGAFFNLVERSGRGNKASSVAVRLPGPPTKSQEASTFKYLRDGVAENWIVEDKLLASVMKNAVHPQAPKPLNRALSLLASIQRKGSIYSPKFVVRNPMRDFAHRLLVGSGQITDSLVNTFNPATEEELNLSGGGQAGMYGRGEEKYHNALLAAMKQLSSDGETILTTPKRLLDAYVSLSEMSESIGRRAEYKTAFNHAKNELGYDDKNASLYAGDQARDLLNYTRGGRLIEWINGYVPFTNAGVQGMSKTFRAMMENPARFSKGFVVFGLVPEIASLLAASMLGYEEEYLDLPLWRREGFWNLRAGGMWITVPKPYEMGAIATLAVRYVNAALGIEQSPDASELVRSASTFSPVGIDDLGGPLRGVIGVMSNYDPYLERSIIPAFDARKIANKRSGADDGSRIGKWLADNTHLGLDSRQMDYFIQTQTAGLGRLALKSSDVGRGTNKTSDWLREMTGLFAPSSPYGTRNLEHVMRVAAENGLERRKELRPLKSILQQYRVSKDIEEQDRLSLLAQKEAKRIRPVIDRLVSIGEKEAKE